MNRLAPIEHNGFRVLTTAQLAESFSSDTKIISKNFERNESRFAEGKHFFLLGGDDLKAYKANRQIDDNLKFSSSLYLWTEKGAWLHAKSLNNDKAWGAYEALVDDYYRIKQPSITDDPQKLIALALVEAQKVLEMKDKQIAVLQPKAEFFDAVADSKDAIDIGTAAKVLKLPSVGRNNLFELMRESGILMPNNQPYQRHIDSGYFRVIEQKYTKPDSSTHISIKTLVYQKGLDFIRRTIEKNGIECTSCNGQGLHGTGHRSNVRAEGW